MSEDKKPVEIRPVSDALVASRKATMLQCLKKTRGAVVKAAEMAGISKATHALWLKKDKKYFKAVQNVKHEVTEYVIGKLMDNIDAGLQRAIEYYLDNNGQEFGFGKNIGAGGDTEHTTVIVLMPDGSLPPVYTEEAEVLAILPDGKKE